jgi:molybdopterin biosynthesis enzyme
MGKAMEVLTLQTGPDAGTSFLGAVLCQNVRRSSTSKAIALRKGQIVHEAELDALRLVDRQEVRVIRLGEGDVHEDKAGRRLAAAIAGPGLQTQGPVQSRINLVAATRGVAVINRAALTAVNLVPDVSVFTVLPYQPVQKGENIAGVKVVPVVVREASVVQVETIARQHWPIVQVRPFLPLAVGVISKQRPDATLRQRFEEIIQRKLAWFGASLRILRYVDPDVASVTAGFREAIAAGVDVILTAGSSSADPLDSLPVSIEVLGGRVEVRGTPTHPGSFFWLAYLDDRPILGMPSCGSYSESTVVDLLLLRVMAGIKPNRTDIAELGVGGLLGPGFNVLFPQYVEDAI